MSYNSNHPCAFNFGNHSDTLQVPRDPGPNSQGFGPFGNPGLDAQQFTALSNDCSQPKSRRLPVNTQNVLQAGRDDNICDFVRGRKIITLRKFCDEHGIPYTDNIKTDGFAVAITEWYKCQPPASMPLKKQHLQGEHSVHEPKPTHDKVPDPSRLMEHLAPASMPLKKQHLQGEHSVHEPKPTHNKVSDPSRMMEQLGNAATQGLNLIEENLQRIGEILSVSMNPGHNASKTQNGAAEIQAFLSMSWKEIKDLLHNVDTTHLNKQVNDINTLGKIISKNKKNHKARKEFLTELYHVVYNGQLFSPATAEAITKATTSSHKRKRSSDEVKSTHCTDDTVSTTDVLKSKGEQVIAAASALVRTVYKRFKSDNSTTTIVYRQPIYVTPFREINNSLGSGVDKIAASDEAGENDRSVPWSEALAIRAYMSHKGMTLEDKFTTDALKLFKGKHIMPCSDELQHTVQLYGAIDKEGNLI